VNHLHRDLAPVSDATWDELEREVRRALRTVLAARRVVDVSGPHGYRMSALDLGRTRPPEDAGDGVTAAVRQVLPLVELRCSFEISWDEIDAIDRGAPAIDLEPATRAALAAARVEDEIVFHGMESASIAGLVDAAEHPAVPGGGDPTTVTQGVARAVTTLKEAGVEGPYALAMGTSGYTNVVESTDEGYPVLEHLRLELEGGSVVLAPALDGAVVLSLRGGDFEIVLGEDFSLGFVDRSSSGVTFRLEETMLFRANGPEAAVPLALDASSTRPRRV